MYLYLWILWCLLYPWSLIADAPFSLFPFSRRKLYLPSVDRPWPLSCERAKKDPVIFASRAVDLCVACDEPVETIYYSFWICSKEVACKTNGQQVVDLFGVEWVLTCQEYGFQATPLDDVLAACVDFFEDSCVPQINHGTFWHLQSLRPCRFLSGKVSWRSQESGLEVAIRSGCLCVEVAGNFIQLSQSRAVEWLKMKSCFCDWCLIPRNRFFLPIFSRCFWEAD